eukprot:6481091-Pyramimonas_sp.AAC.2
MVGWDDPRNLPTYAVRNNCMDDVDMGRAGRKLQTNTGCILEPCHHVPELRLVLPLPHSQLVGLLEGRGDTIVAFAGRPELVVQELHLLGCKDGAQLGRIHPVAILPGKMF